MDAERVLIVAAHPDDETIGAGIWMARFANREAITIVHVTDGSPRNMSDARAAGFHTREDYAAERRRELYAAVGLAGIRPDQCRELGFVDQESWRRLPELVVRIREVVAELRPELVLTHPYEGGHPDHDACAFAVAQVLDGAGYQEFAGYHNGPEGMVTGEFLDEPRGEIAAITLTPAERELKAAMFSSFATQRRILSMFRLENEKFRTAPSYDFTRPPHAGELLYERFGFASGEEWRRSAARALDELAKERALV